MILGLVGPRLGVSLKVLWVVAVATSSYEGTAVTNLGLRLRIGGVSFRVLSGRFLPDRHMHFIALALLLYAVHAWPHFCKCPQGVRKVSLAHPPDM